MEKVFAGRTVTTKLNAAETALDTAVLEMSALLTTMIEVRRDLGLSPTVGSDAVAKVTAALTALGEAGAALSAGHRELEVLRRALHIPATAHMPIKVPLLASAEERNSERNVA